MEVVLGDHAASLSGLVTGLDEQAVAEATVILVAADAATAPAPNQIFSAKTGKDGAFSISNVPPGRYGVAAARGVPEGQETSPEMARWAAAATPVVLAPREMKNLMLRASVMETQR